MSATCSLEKCSITGHLKYIMKDDFKNHIFQQIEMICSCITRKPVPVYSPPHICTSILNVAYMKKACKRKDRARLHDIVKDSKCSQDFLSGRAPKTQGRVEADVLKY